MNPEISTSLNPPRVQGAPISTMCIFSICVTILLFTSTHAQNLKCPEPGQLAEALSNANPNTTKKIICRLRRFGGPVPSQIGRLTELEELIIPRNQLTGTIPTEIGLLRKLSIVDFQENLFTGALPFEFGNLVRLTRLRLGYNQWNWTLPSSLKKLSMLSLFEATYSGMERLPEVIEEYTSLKNLRLKGNAIKQKIPTGLSKLVLLQEFHLGENQLSGPIPPQLSSWRNIEDMKVHGNDISGSLPTQIGFWTNMRELSISDNQFTGALPTEIGKMREMKQLGLQENRFSSKIPSELGNLVVLEDLQLYTNFFTSSIPIELKNLSALTVFRVDPSLLKPCELQFEREIEGWDKAENCSVSFDSGSLNYSFVPTLPDELPTMNPTTLTFSPVEPTIGPTRAFPSVEANQAGVSLSATIFTLVLFAWLLLLVRCIVTYRSLVRLEGIERSSQARNNTSDSTDTSGASLVRATSENQERSTYARSDISPT